MWSAWKCSARLRAAPTLIPTRSDADFLVTFSLQARDDLSAFADFKEGLEALLGRPVDLTERAAIEASRNYIRRRRILGEAEAVYG